MTDDAVAAAADAGAAMLLSAPDEPSEWWVDFTGQGPRLALPAAVLSEQEAEQVSDRLPGSSGGHSKRLRLELSGDQQVPYRYDVVQVSPHRVPERVVHTVSARNTATVTANYHDMGGERWSKEQRFAWRPWQETTIVASQHELAMPQSRIEYVSSGAGDTLWRQHVLHYNSWDLFSPVQGGSIHELRTYEPGESVVYDWYRGLQRPAVVGKRATRTGDDLTIDVAEFVQGTGQTYQRAASEEEAVGRVLEDGGVVVEEPGVSGTYAAPGRSGHYQVEPSTRRDQPDWTFSTATDTVWTFDSVEGAGHGLRRQHHDAVGHSDLRDRLSARIWQCRPALGR